jgi:hypothetical protein
MFENIVRKDIEFHVYRHNSNGMPIGVITAKPVTIFFDTNEISDEEVRTIVDHHRDDILNCICDDDRLYVMPTPTAEQLIQDSRRQGISLPVALRAWEEDLAGVCMSARAAV